MTSICVTLVSQLVLDTESAGRPEFNHQVSNGHEAQTIYSGVFLVTNDPIFFARHEAQCASAGMMQSSGYASQSLPN